MPARLAANVLYHLFSRPFGLRGFSIGSNDLTQLTLGIDRDSERLSALFRESDPTVEKMIRMTIDGARHAGIPVGLCGQAPSDNPAFAAFLVKEGISSISVTPDSFISVKAHVAETEAQFRGEPVHADARAMTAST